jgi:RNA polymerase sigma-70 factor (ECF subfamily)
LPPNLDDVRSLLETHGARLHALFFRLTLRHDAAEDLLQNLFCKLAQSERFAQADDRLAYAIRMATNLAFDYRRSRKRRETAELMEEPVGPSQASPLAEMVRREEWEEVLDAVGRLDSPGRELIVLRHLERQSYEEIARQVGKTAHQTRALAHKALEKLRTMLRRPPLVRPAPREPQS